MCVIMRNNDIKHDSILNKKKILYSHKQKESEMIEIKVESGVK